MNYAMMHTAGHELTHFIKDFADAGLWNDYQEFVMDHLYEKMSDAEIEKRIKDHIKRAEKRGETMTRDGALEEVIADASGEALMNITEADLRQIAQSNPTLFGRIKQFFKKWLSDLKTNIDIAYSGNQNKTAETKAMHDVVDQLSEKWNKMFVNGVQNRNVASEATNAAAQETRANAIAFEDYAFADAGDVRYQARGKVDDDTSSIKKQIAENREKLNAMEPVFVKNINLPKAKKKELIKWAADELASTGYQVDRQGFGKIIFDKDRIDTSFDYLNSPGEFAAILAVPRVLKRGMMIGEHGSHKYRGFPTITFAAPVEINGVRGNMAVVVKMEGRNTYKTHRILMPDGSAFVYNENAEPTPARGVAMNGSYALPISSASNGRIPQNKAGVKKLSACDTQTETPAFQNWFKGSKIVNEDGSPKVMYHGTPYGGFTVFKDWQYFTDNQGYADVYHEPSASSIRGRYNPATNPQTYAVYLSVKKPFDTRDPKIRKIWQEEFYNQYSRTPLSEKGLPDWTDGIDLVEFIEDNDYDFDAIILDEGAVGGYGDDVHTRGVSVVVRSSNQVKSAMDNIDNMRKESANRMQNFINALKK